MIYRAYFKRDQIDTVPNRTETYVVEIRTTRTFYIESGHEWNELLNMMWDKLLSNQALRPRHGWTDWRFAGQIDTEREEEYMFWKYDRFPYILGAPIETIEEDNYFPKGYKGYRSPRPLYITSLEEGEMINSKLDLIKQRHRQAVRDLHDKDFEEVRSLFPQKTRKAFKKW